VDKSRGGQSSSGYAHVENQGETVLATGTKTSVEPTRLVNTLSAATQQNFTYLGHSDLVSPIEELVMQVAAHWSVDHTTLQGRQDIALGKGWQGYYNRK
jgi:hypothetical protein